MFVYILMPIRDIEEKEIYIFSSKKNLYKYIEKRFDYLITKLFNYNIEQILFYNELQIVEKKIDKI